MEQFVALAAAAAARCAEEEAGAVSSALQGTAPSPAGASASSRALAREEWLRRRESHLEDARRAQQLQKEREVAHYFSPEINKTRFQGALSARSVLDRQADWVRSRDDKMRRLALEAEERARQECTFHPSISEASRAHPGRLPAEVRAALVSPTVAAGGGAQRGAELSLHGSDPAALTLARKSATEAAFVDRMRRAQQQREELAAINDEKVGLRADVTKAKARQRPAAAAAAGGAGAGAGAAAASEAAAAAAAAAGIATAAAAAAAAGASAADHGRLSASPTAAAPSPAPRPPSSASPLSPSPSNQAAAVTLRAAILAGLQASRRASPQPPPPGPHRLQHPPHSHAESALYVTLGGAPVELRPSRDTAPAAAASASSGMFIYSSPPPISHQRLATPSTTSNRALYASAGGGGGGAGGLAFGPSIPVVYSSGGAAPTPQGEAGSGRWVVRSGTGRLGL